MLKYPMWKQTIYRSILYKNLYHLYVQLLCYLHYKENTWLCGKETENNIRNL